MTVAVLDPDKRGRTILDERDVEITTTRGTGPGGQHRNKTDSCVVARHRPTGQTVRVDMRSQHQSRAMALQILAARLDEAARETLERDRNAARRTQLGSGMRGDKIRTYREQDDRVTDHRTGQTFSLKKWLRADWA